MQNTIQSEAGGGLCPLQGGVWQFCVLGCGVTWQVRMGLFPMPRGAEVDFF